MEEFIKNQDPQIQLLYEIYYEGVQNGLAPEQLKLDMAARLVVRYSIPKEAADKMAAAAYIQFSNPEFATKFNDLPSSDPLPLWMSQQDYDYFVSFTSADPDVTDEIRALLLSFIAVYRHDYHHTGWVKYDRKNIFYLAGLSRLSVTRQKVLTNYLHDRYDLQMQVVGSNQPIPCFKFPWLYEQPVSDPIKLGPLSPSTIQIVLSDISAAASATTQGGKF